MANNKECLIHILKTHGDDKTTEEIIKHASEYPDICSGCKSGSDVMIAAMVLLKKGTIRRDLGKGGCRWSLTK